jgi:Flp pilus assembly protein TadG
MVALDRMQASMTTRKQKKFDNRGQALVEFALLLPFVLLLLIGIVEFGRAWQAKQTLTDAAREGARLAAVGNPTYTLDTVRVKVKTMMNKAGFDSSQVTITYPDGCRFPTCSPITSTNWMTSVTLAMPYRFVALHRLITLVTNGGNLTFRSTARMRIE